jgi:hypothetical protein
MIGSGLAAGFADTMQEQETIMSDIIVEATGLPLRFPDPREEAYARAQEFRRLSPDGRWQAIAALMEFGLNMARSSPRRAAIEQRWETQEAEWQRLQHKLMVQHGK